MNRIIYVFLISCVICFALQVYTEGAQNDLKDNITRLHIIANSNTQKDQEIKLKVRDEILKYVKEYGMANREQKFLEIRNKVLCENGFAYKSKVEFGNFMFPRKEYNELMFPKGEYRGMRVILGEGNGENWWCVMNPPLCFTENSQGTISDTGRKELQNNLNDETYDIITDKKKVKFKIVEIVNEIISHTKEN